jgi:hypothetical protein
VTVYRPRVPARSVLAIAILISSSAHAEPRPAAQLDLGLAVIGAAYEHPVADQLAIQLGAQVVSTYFAPWFDAGDAVAGLGGSLRVTYFASREQRGLYVAPFLRVTRMTGEHDTGASGADVGFSTGAWVGYAARATPRLDVRIGGGVQYLRYLVDTSAGRVGVDTPFVALDLVVGYRL